MKKTKKTISPRKAHEASKKELKKTRLAKYAMGGDTPQIDYSKYGSSTGAGRAAAVDEKNRKAAVDNMPMAAKIGYGITNTMAGVLDGVLQTDFSGKLDNTKMGQNEGFSNVNKITDGIGTGLGMAGQAALSGLTGGGAPAAMGALGAVSNMFADGGDIQNIEGPKHGPGGGVPLDIDGDGQAEIEAEGGETTDGEFIFSDRLKAEGGKKTFADISKEIEKKYQTNEDPLSTKTKDFELDMLKEQNRQAKAAKEETTQGGLPMAADGLDLTGTNVNDYNMENPNPVIEPFDIMSTEHFSVPNYQNGTYSLSQDDTPQNITTGNPIPGRPTVSLPSNSPSPLPQNFKQPSNSPSPLPAPQNFKQPLNTLPDRNKNTTPGVVHKYDPAEQINTKKKLNSKVTNTNYGNSGTAGDKWQGLGSAVGPLGNAALLAADIASKPEKVERKYNDSAIPLQQLSDRQGRKDSMQAFTAAKEAIGKSGRNFNANAQNLQGLMGKTQANLGDHTNKVGAINAQAKNVQATQRATQKGQYITDFNKYEELDAMNAATRKNAIRDDATSLLDTSAQGMKNIGDIKNQRLTNDVQFKTLNSLYGKYKLTGETLAEFQKRVNKGEDVTEYTGGTKSTPSAQNKAAVSAARKRATQKKSR